MPLNDPIIQNPDEILEQQAISAPAPTATTTATPAACCSSANAASIF